MLRLSVGSTWYSKRFNAIGLTPYGSHGMSHMLSAWWLLQPWRETKVTYFFIDFRKWGHFVWPYEVVDGQAEQSKKKTTKRKKNTKHALANATTDFNNNNLTRGKRYPQQNQKRRERARARVCVYDRCQNLHKTGSRFPLASSPIPFLINMHTTRTATTLYRIR